MGYFVVRIIEVLAFDHAGAAGGALSYGYLICDKYFYPSNLGKGF